MQFIKNNKFYLGCFLIFLLLGAGVLLNIQQGDAILFFSERRNPYTDFFFKYFTKVGEEHGYILVISIFMFVRFRYALLSFLAGVSALILSYLIKSYFKHPRPKVYFSREGTLDQLQTIDGVYLLSGSLSFPSGHTASGFALYGLIAFLVGKRWYWQIALFLVAFLVGLSRIYLIQHFLKDVYLGAIVGTFIAWVIYIINSRFPYNDKRWIDRSFGKKRLDQA